MKAIFAPHKLISNVCQRALNFEILLKINSFIKQKKKLQQHTKSPHIPRTQHLLDIRHCGQSTKGR